MNSSGSSSRIDQLVIIGTFRLFIISSHRWSVLSCSSTITWLLAPSGEKNTWTGVWTHKTQRTTDVDDGVGRIRNKTWIWSWNVAWLKDLTRNYRVAQESKLFILCGYVDETEKIRGTWTNTNNYRENEALSDIFTWDIFCQYCLCLNILWLKAVSVGTTNYYC